MSPYFLVKFSVLIIAQIFHGAGHCMRPLLGLTIVVLLVDGNHESYPRFAHPVFDFDRVFVLQSI